MRQVKKVATKAKIVGDAIITFSESSHNPEFQALATANPVAVATASRFLTHCTVNGIAPLFLMDFLTKEYPDAAKAMQDTLKDVAFLMPLFNLVIISGMATGLEYLGRRYTHNLLTPHNFRRDAMIGLSFLFAMQTFASTETGKQNAFGDFWNKLSAYNPLMVMFVTFFLVPGIVKSVVALTKETAIRLHRLCATKPEVTAASLDRSEGESPADQNSNATSCGSRLFSAASNCAGRVLKICSKENHSPEEGKGLIQ